jgi:hypothetical protein
MEELIKNKWVVIGVIVLIFGIIGIKALNAPEKSDERKFMDQLTSATHDIDRAVEAAVKEKLAFPEEATFSDPEGFTVVDLSHKKAGTRGYVTGKTAFGLQKKRRYEALITLFEGQVTVIKVTLDE